jgi:hypothetical protein
LPAWHIDRSIHKRKTTPHATSSVWIDEHGRPLSAREIHEIKRLLREGDGRGSRRSGRAPARYHRAGSNATFEDIWR